MSGADRQALVRAFEKARAVDDVDALADAALGIASLHRFGAPAGSAPAYLHEAYRQASGVRRVRLAAALARVWVYAAEAPRAAPFAAEAVELAGALGDPAVLADALDAQLAASWGPDALAERLAVTSRLEDVAAHLLDPGPRLSAYLWRLTTAIESLDALTARRQLRAMSFLAADTGSARVRLFEASRRGMLALIDDDMAAALGALADTRAAGPASGEADAEALEHELAARIAVRCDDRGTLAAEAEAFEAFGVAEGVPAVIAEAASLWLSSGRPERARDLLQPLVAAGLSRVPRDVDWLMILCLAIEVSAGTGADAVTAEAVTLLAPYTGRGVVNAGGVTFLGVVDDYLRLGYAAMGRDDEAAASAERARAAYTHLGANWWLSRVGTVPGAPDGQPFSRASELVAHLVPGPNGVWAVGRAGRTTAIREAKGLRYLRILLERPGAEVSAVELSAAVAGHAPVVGGAGLGEPLDRRALSEYRRRLADIDEELQQARDWADEHRVTSLVGERDLLLDEISSATGLGGRPRRVGDDAERARIAVRKAVTTAITRVADVDADLGRHLRLAVRTGATCRYDPDPDRPIRWVLS